jgi:NAD+ synthase
MVTMENELLTHIDHIPDMISQFIKKIILDDFKKKGTIIGVSGGIDSAVTLALAVKGLGNERVIGMLLPEKESAPSSRELGMKLLKRFNVRFEEVPITPFLESFGVYEKKYALIKKIYPPYVPSLHSTSLCFPRNVFEKDTLNIPHLRIVENGKNIAEKRLHADEILEIISLQNMKQRTRMLVQYMLAEKNHYAVCGTTNKTELLTGHFVKYGDGGVDLEPLADCYKTQVYGVAKTLGIDQEVIARQPSPDTWSNYISDMDFYWRMPYEILDGLLFAEEKKYSLDRIQKSMGLSHEDILTAMKHIQTMKNNAKYLSCPPPICYLPSG